MKNLQLSCQLYSSRHFLKRRAFLLSLIFLTWKILDIIMRWDDGNWFYRHLYGLKTIDQFTSISHYWNIMKRKIDNIIENVDTLNCICQLFLRTIFFFRKIFHLKKPFFKFSILSKASIDWAIRDVIHFYELIQSINVYLRGTSF